MTTQHSPEQFTAARRPELYDIAGAVNLTEEEFEEFYAGLEGEQKRTLREIGTREQLREAERQPIIAVNSKLIMLAAGYASRFSLPQQRHNEAYAFLRKQFESGGRGDQQTAMLTDGALSYLPVVEMYTRIAEQDLLPILSVASTPEDHYHILRQYMRPLNPEDTSDRQLKEDMFKTAFYFAQGPHTANAPISAMEENLVSGNLDKYIVRYELLETEKRHPEVEKLATLAQSLSRGQEGWQDMLTDQLDLLPASVRKLLESTRAEMIASLRQTNNLHYIDMGAISIGANGTSEAQRIELKKIMDEYWRIYQRAMGSTAVEQSQTRSPRKRVRSTDKSVIPRAVSLPEVEAVKSIPIAENTFDYLTGQDTDLTLEQFTNKFVGSYGTKDEAFKEALFASYEHVAATFGKGERGTGIKKLTRNKLVDLYELKASEAGRLPVRHPYQRTTRVFFVHHEDEIKIVHVCNRRDADAWRDRVGGR